jgi:hypothetical protein
MVNPSSIPEQFSYLVVKPLKLSMDNENSIYNVIVIDSIDECSTSWKVESLTKAILGSVTDIPLICVIPRAGSTGVSIKLLRPPSRNCLFTLSMTCNMTLQQTSSHRYPESWTDADILSTTLTGQYLPRVSLSLRLDPTKC